MSFKFRGGEFKEPTFQFNSGKSKDVIEGLQRNGPYDKETRGFDKIRINYVLTSELEGRKLEEEINNFHRHLKDGLGNYFDGLEDLFNLRVEKNLLKSIDELEGSEKDILVIFFSDPSSAHEHQETSLSKGVPSQKLNDSFLLSDNQQAYSNKLRNIALQLYLKRGGIPWKPDRLNTDRPIIGYDTRIEYKEKTNVRISACLFSSEGEFQRVLSKNRETDSDSQWDIRDELLEEIMGEIKGDIQESPIIHKDGEINDWDAQILQDIFSDPTWISVMRNRPYRLYNKETRDYRPDRGVYVKLEEGYYALSTTGRPHHTQGTPRALKVRIENSENAKEDLEDIFKLSGMNYAEKKYTSLPFTAHGAKKAGQKINKNTTLPSLIEDKAWFL